MLVEVKNLSFAYKDRIILDDISFGINEGDTLSILGANGSGKSTLLRIMLGFLKFKGEVLVVGKSVREYSKNSLASLITYVPQTHAPSYEYTVFDVVLMGALCRTPLFSNFSKRDKILAEQSLDKMGILKLRDEPYTRVSGGERQLAYIARTLVQGAKVIFMDEPTNGLDFGNQIKLLEMIKMLKDDGYTFVQTTHYPRHAKFVSNLVLFLKDGKILSFGSSEELINAENIDKIYEVNYEKYKDRL
ncbi:ABC transporter ATP-binding protein [Campylobacter sp. RM16187]|uniref:ABC transporter ATP-binding protein n=1 Tax=Campylobacter sp. RM16187 TaxID=1660063 RepID=UPI0021B64DE8|nr:ABC transporter ATP-binding protein [Campylobacter sp. RM16187]QKG28456.1 ABC transporter, ATP-binding protein [Campylobacter sp. RM16187]